MVYSITFHFCIQIGKYLILGDSAEENYKSIAQFSVRDAEAFPKYEEFLGQLFQKNYLYTCAHVPLRVIDGL